jgi:hypothetical protein
MNGDDLGCFRIPRLSASQGRHQGLNQLEWWSCRWRHETRYFRRYSFHRWTWWFISVVCVIINPDPNINFAEPRYKICSCSKNGTIQPRASTLYYVLLRLPLLAVKLARRTTANFFWAIPNPNCINIPHSMTREVLCPSHLLRTSG